MTIMRCGLLAVLLAGVVSNALAAEPVRLRPTAPLYVDAQGMGLARPESVACDSRGVVVADTGNSRLVRYRLKEDTLTAVATIVSAEVPFPIRVEIDSKDGIVALDGKSRRIARFDSGGTFRGFVEPIGVKGTVVPRSFDIGESDSLWILDIFSGRVLVLDSAGQVQREIAFPPEQRFFSDLAVDRGTVFVLDSVGRRVFAAKGTAEDLTPWSDSLQEDLDFPTALAADGKGRVYVTDQTGGGVVILGQDGSFQGRQSKMGWAEGFLRYPSDLCIDSGRLFIADRGNNRIQPFLFVD